MLLQLHPNKVFIRKFDQGLDFLGYVILPHYRALRTKTKKRLLRKIKARHDVLLNKEISQESFDQTIKSYYGVLKHCKLNKEISQESFDQTIKSYYGVLKHCKGYKIKKIIRSRILS
ncbi:hypothetical protein GW935_02825 [Candidatus Falkowbacteria bacterium]|nr:hypothetical protein [Candidatus Falkowbacteria bacterium]